MYGTKKNNVALKAVLFIAVLGVLTACAGGSSVPETEFIVKDLREVQGKRVPETFNVANHSSDTTLYQDFGARRDFRHTIDLSLTTNKRLDEDRVRNHIYRLYKIPSVEDSKLCLVPVEVSPMTTIIYDLEWIEIMHEGVIEEGKSGGGQQLGTYTVLTSWNCQVIGASLIG